MTQENNTPQENNEPNNAFLALLDDPKFVEALFDHPNVQERLAKLATNIAEHVDRKMRNVMH